MASEESLQNIEESRAVRLAGNLDQYRTLARRIRTILKRKNERYIRELAEDVEGCLNANNLRPAYRALKKLCSMSTTQTSTIRTRDERNVSDANDVRSRWAEYFERLYVAETPCRRPFLTGVEIAAEDPSVDETLPSLAEVRETVNKLKVGKAAGVCSVSAENLKAVGEAMIHGLHAVLTAVGQSGTIPTDLKK